jgi:signal transduction histidine kinase
MNHHLVEPLDTTVERTEVLHGQENVIGVVLHFTSRAKDIIDACIDSTRPLLAIEIKQLRKSFIDSKTRGVKLRYVTEVTKDNINYCKELLKIINQLRHIDGIKGNFYISETEYISPATLHEKEKPASQIIYSNVKEIVEQQKYLFETLWNKAIPAEQKIREIEEGVTLGSTEVILGPSRIQELFIDLVKSAKQEILLILPTTNSFLREHKLGIIQLLKQVASISEYNVNVRILTPTNDAIEKILKNMTLTTTAAEEQKKENEKFGIRRIDLATEFAVSTVTIAVADRQISLAIEKKDDTKENFIDAIGMATYSTSKPTVSSYVSIFENLWAQTELYRQVKESNRQIALANEQLKIKDKMQKEFINVASHEIKTPTQALLGYSEILQRHPEKREEISQAIFRNANRLQRLTNDILDVTRIESQTLKLNKEQFDLNDILSNVIADYRSQIEKAGKSSLKLLACTDACYIIDADKNRLTQVISNLLSNAIKFTEEGTITIATTLRDNEDAKEKEVLVSVKDTGIGITSETFARLFSKFASSSGTGLGLFISKSIIEAQGGRIWAENNIDGKGATFTFSLPVSKQRHQQLPQPSLSE